MDIHIGQDVVGRDGKLGEVHRVIVDARSAHVTDLVVKHGSLFGSERILPLGCVAGVENNAVKVDLDQKAFEALNGFTDDRYRAPDPNYSAPPGFRNEEFLIDSAVAFSGGAPGAAHAGGATLGYPGGQQVSPDDMQRPAYSQGTPVLDAEGAKVGELERMAFDSTSGEPTHIVLRRGFLFHHEAELPMSWVQEHGDSGIMLNVNRAEVEQRLANAATAH